MSTATLALSAAAYAYLHEVGLREPSVLVALREASDALPEGGARSATEQALLLAFLAELMGARRVLEVGCLTGYTTLALALALPPGGRAVTLDVDEETTALGRRHWAAAGVAERIELRLGPAAESMRAMLAAGEAGSFDLVYVDADKKGYPTYFELALELVRPGGLIALDNVLWKGAVADPADHSRQATVLRELNARLHGDERISLVMLPIGDGMTLTRRR